MPVADQQADFVSKKDIYSMLIHRLFAMPPNSLAVDDQL